MLMLLYVFFFCKQKTAYEMRISDWSSDVCSSDLPAIGNGAGGIGGAERTDQHLALRMDRRAAGIAELIPAAHVRRRQLMAMIGFDRQRPGIVDAYACTGAHTVEQRLVGRVGEARSEEHTSELQSLMRISYAVFCLKKKKKA